MDKLIVNPEFQSLIPPLSPDEYNQLEQNILDEGCRDAIVIWRGTVVDGHNRYELCVKHSIPYQTVEKEFESDEQVIEWIIRNQFGRRNLSPYQRTELALKLKPIIEAKAKKNQGTRNDLNICQKSDKCEKLINQKPDESIDTKKELAQIAGVSHDTIHKVETIQNQAPEPIKEAVKSNKISVSKGYDMTKQVKDLPEKEKKEKAEQLLTEQKQAKKAAKSKKSSQKQLPTPSIENTAELGEATANKDDEPVKQGELSEEEKAKNEESLPDVQEQIEKPVEPDFKIEPAISINDAPELQKILEDMVADLGVSIGQVETIVNELPELGEIKHTLKIYHDALLKYAERLNSILKLKLKEEKRDVG